MALTEKRVTIRSEVDIVAARREGREMGTGLGLSSTEATMVATAISEIARNILRYAGEGEILLSVENKAGKPGLVVVGRDSGPGIADVQLAMQDGYSSSNSLGLGLPGARRLMDEFDIVSAPGKGTTVTMKRWARR